jgi:hypothetical protein
MRTPQNCRLIRDDVNAYCVALGLGEAQTRASIETALVAHSIAAGKKTADRLKQKIQARELRARCV